MDLLHSDWKYVAERAGAFVGREWVFARVRSFLSGPPGTFLLRGDPGTGKTAVAARLVQASFGVLDPADFPPPVDEGAISAAVFCRVGQATIPELAQQLSNQLAASVAGFSDARLAAVGPGTTIGDVHIDVRGDVHPGGTVSGVVLPREDGKQAFSMGVAVPLRQLRERGASQPIVLLVDAVDEAADATEVNTLSRLLAKLDGVHLIVTCRPDPSVLFDFRKVKDKLDLIADAPADDDDVRRYVRNRLAGQGLQEMIDVLVGRVSGVADGNFLYAFYVTGTLIESGNLAGMDEQTARELPLPTGGLAGVYEDFLDRQVSGDDARWAGELRPVLAPLCVALGDGLNTEQLAAIASRLTGQEFSSTKAGDVTRAAGQFLDGPRPNGPFRMYHQSFSRFLTDPGQNQYWPINLAETNSAVAEALIGSVPEGQPGVRDWAAASAYVRRHLAGHAAAAGILDDLLLDIGYLLATDPLGLLAYLSEARTQPAQRASAAYRRVVHRLADSSEPARESYLRLAALQVGADELLTTGAVPKAEGPAWLSAWGWWRPATATRVVGQLPSVAATLAAVLTEQGPLAVAGGDFGLEVWDIESGQRLATHQWKVVSVAVGQAGGQPVVLAGHGDGMVSVHALPSLQLVARDDSTHLGSVLAAAALGDGSIVATGDQEGALVLWQLPALAAVAIRQQAHTMVRALAGAALSGVPLLISAGDTVGPGGYRNSATSPVRAWTLPGLHLHSEIETAIGLATAVVAASTPLGCIVAYEKSGGVAVKLIAPDDSVTVIGAHSPGPFTNDLLVVRPGSEPLIMACSAALLPLRISLPPVPALTPGLPVETDVYSANWAGPIDVMGRTFLVSAKETLRVWDLDELLAASAQQDDLEQRQAEYHVVALAVAGDVLAAQTGDGSVRRWRWRSGEALEPLDVHSTPVQTLASCVLAGRPHFALAHADGVVEAFDAESGRRWPAGVEVAAPLQTMAVAEYGGRTVAATAVQLGRERESPEGDRPFYGVRLWDLTTGEEISTRQFEWMQPPDGASARFMWKFSMGGYAHKEIRHLALVGTSDDLLIAANTAHRTTVWPLKDPESEFEVGDRSHSINALIGQRDLLIVAGRDGWELYRLSNRASFNSRARDSGVAALAFGSWPEEALLSGGSDGWLRVWSQNSAYILGVDLDEQVTAVACLPKYGAAVGTRRGVVIFWLKEVGIRQAQRPLDAKVASLRASVREQRAFSWNWRNWRSGIFPPATPESYTGPIAEIVELIVGSPREAFRALSSWLEDDTPLVRAEKDTVADVACALMAAYSQVGFDDLCEAVADARTVAGTGSGNPSWLLRVIMQSAPDAGTSVCERWAARGGQRAELASICAHSILWTQPPSELRERLLAAEIRIHSANPTPIARTEALHVLAAWPQTRDLVLDELVDRFLGRAEGYIDTTLLSDAFATHFDRVLFAFNQKLMRDPAHYDGKSLSALARYAPASDAEAGKIMDLLEQLWAAGPGRPASTLAENLVSFAAHARHVRDRAVALAFRVAQSSDSVSAYRPLAWAAVADRDPEFRRQVFGTVIESGEPKMNEALVAELVSAIDTSGVEDETLFELVLRVGAAQLETYDLELLRAAEGSGGFASALARVVEHATLSPSGLLAIFARLAAHDPDPQHAARQAIETSRKDGGGS